MNASVIQVVEIDDDFDLISDTNRPPGRPALKIVPPPTAAQFSDDPVALSIQSYLIWKSNPHRRWVALNEVGQVTSQARTMAQELRTYYLHRNTIKILLGQKPTDFQNKMIGLLSDTRALQQDELGLLYRLPYFWQEDVALDQVFETAVSPGTGQSKDQPVIRSVIAHATLTPVQEVLKSRRSGDMAQFWFANSHGELCVYSARADNGMISVFRSLFKRPELQVKSHATLHTLPGSHIQTKFWRLTGLEIE